MKNMQQRLRSVMDKLELPTHVIEGLPQITVNGFREASVDQSLGLISYSREEIRVAVREGTVIITGGELLIRLMRQGRIVVAGSVCRVELVREARNE